MSQAETNSKKTMVMCKIDTQINLVIVEASIGIQ